MIFQVIRVAFNQKISNNCLSNPKMKEDGKNSIMVDTFLTIRQQLINKLNRLQNILANHLICLNRKRILIVLMWLAK